MKEKVELRAIVKKEIELLNHVCYHESKITDMHKILVGNGDPEKSLVSQVILINERQQKAIEKLEEIKQARKNIVPYIINVIGAISALTLMYFGYQELKNQGDEIKSETKTTNEILIPSTSRRGTYYTLPIDSLNKINK